ncbi:MAG TPA: bifunctional glutamate N-acetyltransferase/amino-acid acetyltransferase ArgJ [Terriglobales bacterium]|jgi:glutamate N-acetyltransferase/amino-acid N-acetyltransferase|nr:bifunctional glutamate N-acetyltransferase/amino-acid acetyltransferase ArgJ [Terriglobales bacterium]
MTRLRRTPEKILLPRGFSFSALAANIKASGRPDLALVDAGANATAAAVFTKNLVVAAPLVVGRASLLATAGKVRAVLVNSGNANCATGRDGLRACERTCHDAGKLLGVSAAEIFPSSTGIIGVRFPAEKAITKLPELIGGLASNQAAAMAFARAIMTTDTRAKIASRRFKVGSKEVTVLGIAKGSGMIHPNLATMLVYLFTDVAAGPRELKRFLREASDPSLNSMSVDGDTSTNDTVLLLANGQSGCQVGHAGVRKKFAEGLRAVCQSLAEQIVTDGEGVQHVIRLFVEQARSREEALHVARTIAHSALVKTAWAGADPNWGRILAAVGRSGVAVDPGRVRIFIGDQMVCRDGVACSFDEGRAHWALSESVCDVRVKLGRGKGSVRFLTTDLTAEYVRINADYST